MFFTHVWCGSFLDLYTLCVMSCLLSRIPLHYTICLMYWVVFSISLTGLSKKTRKSKTAKKSGQKESAVNDSTTEAKAEAHDISKQMEAV